MCPKLASSDSQLFAMNTSRFRVLANSFETRPVEDVLSKTIYQSNDHEMLQYRPTSPETSTESKRGLEFQENECVRILAPKDI